MHSTQKPDIKKLRDNLKDLNHLTSNLMRDIANKNKILESGINDCDNCHNYIKKSKLNK